MGLYDRPYWQGQGQPDGGGGGGTYGGGVFQGMPKPTTAIKWLLIANLVLFFAGRFRGVHDWLAVAPVHWWQLWRFVTFQFLHSGPMHLLFNMIGLYFLGGILERSWGARRFTRFYLICGVVGGLCHMALVVVRILMNSKGVHMADTLVGASGGVFAVIIATAILFPQLRVIALIFPMSIRTAAVLFLVMGIIGMLGRGEDKVAHAAHLGGAAAGAFWVWILPKLQQSTRKARTRRGDGAWKRKLERQAQEQAEVDRILDKIRQRGIQSLSSREKRTLQNATRKQKKDL